MSCRLSLVTNETLNELKKMNLICFGPNLKYQSKGQFIVHAFACRDCIKLSGENFINLTASTKAAVVTEIYADMISGESGSVEGYMREVHFAPCVTLP